MSGVPDSIDPKPQADLTERAELPAPSPLEAQTTVKDVPGLHASVYAIGAALLAGSLAWGIGEQTYDCYRPPASAHDARDFSTLNREKRIADRVNSAIAFGTFGALMGLFSGAAGGALRRSVPGGASAALAGLLLGGIGGALVSYELAPIQARFFSDESPSLLLSLVVRGGVLAVVGITAGLAFGWGWQGLLGIPRGLLGGLAGSVCGTIAFELANAILFPADRNDEVIPSSMQARVLVYLFVSLCVAIGAVLFGRHQPSPPGRPSPAHS